MNHHPRAGGGGDPAMPGRGAKRPRAGESSRFRHRPRTRPNEGQTPPDQHARTRQRTGITAFADGRECEVMKAEAREAGLNPPAAAYYTRANIDAPHAGHSEA